MDLKITLQSTINMFLAKYKLEAMKRGVKPIVFAKDMLALLLSEALAEIQRRHSVIMAGYDLSITADTYEYTLPDGFGRIIKIMDSDDELTEHGFTEIWTLIKTGLSNSDTGTPEYYAMVDKVDNSTGTAVYEKKLLVYPIPSSSGTLSIYYYPTITMLNTNVDGKYFWGSYDGESFTGDLIFPDRYSNAIVLYMLAQIFDDIYQKYEREMEILKETQPTTYKWDRQYRINGGIG